MDLGKTNVIKSQNWEKQVGNSQNGKYIDPLLP